MWPGDFEVVALDGLDLAAHPGELVAVMGRPGPGKAAARASQQIRAAPCARARGPA